MATIQPLVDLLSRRAMTAVYFGATDADKACDALVSDLLKDRLRCPEIVAGMKHDEINKPKNQRACTLSWACMQ